MRRGWMTPGFLGASALTVVLSACGTRTPPPPAPRPTARPPVVQSIKVSPAEYMTNASSASLFVVRASELVVLQGGAAGAAQLATRFAAEQKGVGAQLSLAGRRLNLLPSATLLPRHQTLLDELAQSNGSPSVYARQLKSVLGQAAALHRQYARYGTSPTLRPVAGMAAPVMERELGALRGY